jgi:hypothetical protein
MHKRCLACRERGLRGRQSGQTSRVVTKTAVRRWDVGRGEV